MCLRVLLYLITFEKQLVHTDQLRGPGGLDSCPFQHTNESTLFLVPSLFQKGRFPYTEKAWSKIFFGGSAPGSAPGSPFSFFYCDKKWEKEPCPFRNYDISKPVLPLGRKFPFLRKCQPSEGNQKEIEFRRKKKEIRVKYKEY